MSENLESLLTPDQKAGHVVHASDSLAWLVWKLRLKDRPMIGIMSFRKQPDGWNRWSHMIWEEAAVVAAAAAIAEIDAGNAPPPIDNPKLAALRIDEWTTYDGHWIVPIDKKKVIAVYRFIYDGTPSVMLREYKQPGWKIAGYLIIDRPSAIAMANHVAAMTS